MDKIRTGANFESHTFSSFESRATSSSYNYSSSSQQNVPNPSLKNSSNGSTQRQRELDSMKTKFLTDPHKITKPGSIIEYDAQPFKHQAQRRLPSNSTSVAPTTTPVRNTSTTICNHEPNTDDKSSPSFLSRLFSFRSSRRRAGYAVIFNHEKFEGKPPRTGTHHDVINLKTALNNFNIETYVKHDLTLAQITRKVNKLKKLNFSKYECFIIVILTHGDNRQLYAKDVKYEFIELIEDPILKTNNTLLDVTKIFITQVSCDQKFETDAVPISKPSAPIKRNILKCKSLYFDTNIQNGTSFVKSLCHALHNRGQYDDLYNIFNAIGNEVMTESTMTKQCILGQLLKNKTK